ncbi:uncharacterized protein KY384_001999 [Bacidia gigantensis]|uniref:uncharacterized protein n=1 Tax=Bacidia gigantensis TaxID=2732470 RepID=UPI001D047DF6|nr:uncharacterized protein KY384_001999 [Bacidia gigantensis]KAG8533216.1 hypothetical protein KY384_001999 [Bacidia gigantensis]
MASTTSQHRAQLLREMNKARSSSSSSRHSESPQPTISNFDPDNEAMMSTRQLENNVHRFPDLRASAQKYKRPNTFEPEYVIDTSAIGRAFPDFSQGDTSSNASLSIEMGRGTKAENQGLQGRSRRAREYSSNADILDDDTLNLKDHIASRYNVRNTPPPNQKPGKEAPDTFQPSARRYSHAPHASGLKNEFEPSPPEKAKDYGSGESRKSSEGSRRGLAAMHARVSDENDISKLADEPPPTTTELTVRKTRFGNGKMSQSATDKNMPTRFSSTQGLASAKQALKNTAAFAATRQGTQQSFTLPEMPNISELVSGVFEDGTPIFSRHSKSRVSQFLNGDGSVPHAYTDVDEIPVPYDEQAIFLSLKLLQDKVAILEREKAEFETYAKDQEEKNRVLEAERLPRRRFSGRSDSALGITDSDGGDEMPKGSQRESAIQRSRKCSHWYAPLLADICKGLESTVRALHKEVDASNRRATTAETILNNITRERDSTVNQLSVAFVTIERLKAENQNLREGNQALKSLASQAEQAYGDDIHKDTSKVTTSKHRAIEPRRTAKEAPLSNLEQPPPFAARVSSEGPKTSRVEISNKCDDYDDNSLFDLTPRQNLQTRPADAQGSKGYLQQAKHRAPLANQQASTNLVISDSFGKGEIGKESRDLTNLTSIDAKEIENLRRTIEHERLEQKGHLATKHASKAQDAISKQKLPVESHTQLARNMLPQKSAMKSHTETTKSVPRQYQNLAKENTTDHSRRHSETSVLSTKSRRRRLNAENMTSAFILPDITISKPNTCHEDTNLTNTLPEATVNESKHEPQNCNVCKHDQHHDHGRRKATIIVPKPIPVSERMPEPNEGDQTLRPAQTPALALATVLKGLYDEMAHLKMTLGKYQMLFDSHDPSLSRRKRKAIQSKIESLLQTIDLKADQFYALYDVLEGQKGDGQELSEEQVEVTLQSIGIGHTGAQIQGGGSEVQHKVGMSERQPWDLGSEDGSEEEMPWEGIESTIETTRTGHRRRASAT